MVSYSRHIEDQQIRGMRLGRRPHDPDRPVLRLADVLTGQAVPAHGVSSDHISKVKDWGLYNNDKYGICGPTMVGNARKQVTKYLTAAEVSPPQADVDDLYRRSGNPGYDPAHGVDGNGVVLADMLSEVHKNGIGGIKAVAYAAVDVSNEAEVQAAIDIFGDLHLGCPCRRRSRSRPTPGCGTTKSRGCGAVTPSWPGPTPGPPPARTSR
jgi:hypothetical protein